MINVYIATVQAMFTATVVKVFKLMLAVCACDEKVAARGVVNVFI